MTSEQYKKFIQWANFVKDVPPNEFHIGAYNQVIDDQQKYCALGLLPIVFFDEFIGVDTDQVNFYAWAANFFGSHIANYFADYDCYDASMYPPRYNYSFKHLEGKSDPSPIDVYDKMLEVLADYLAKNPIVD